jgi:hypothetical protein
MRLRSRRQRERRRSPRLAPAISPPTEKPAVRPRRTLADRDSLPAMPESAHRVGRFWLQRAGLLILVVAVLVSVVNILSLSGQAKIIRLGASGQLLRPTADYETAADQILATSVWNRNKITANTGQVSRQLLAHFPELTAASITVPLLAHQPLVYITPAQPRLVLIAADGAFLVSDSGKAVLSAPTPAALNQPKLPTVTDQSGLQAHVNSQVLPSRSVRFIQTVVAELAAKQVAVSGLDLPAGSSELDAHLSGLPYLVKFNLQSDDARGESGTYLATAAQLHRQSVTPAQYIDVRVTGRAYYK